jgi:ribosome-associated toxin RatA of RatAB toxin-antitoxin module
MPTVESTVEIEAPAAALFALAQDYDLRLRWDPFLREMEFLDGASEAAVGGRVRVRARNGLGMEVRYTTLEPPGHVAVVMVKGPWIFRTFAGAWRFRALGPARTQVSFRYHFRGRWRALERPVACVLRREMDRRVRALKAAAEDTNLLTAASCTDR